jgi:hypothetical protein
MAPDAVPDGQSGDADDDLIIEMFIATGLVEVSGEGHLIITERGIAELSKNKHKLPRNASPS